jgi:hypothetical protein
LELEFVCEDDVEADVGVVDVSVTAAFALYGFNIVSCTVERRLR